MQNNYLVLTHHQVVVHLLLLLVSSLCPALAPSSGSAYVWVRRAGDSGL